MPQKTILDIFFGRPPKLTKKRYPCREDPVASSSFPLLCTCTPTPATGLSLFLAVTEPLRGGSQGKGARFTGRPPAGRGMSQPVFQL